jgi:hypothetical protein
MMFYLGTHLSSWLDRTEVPLFVSRRQMPKKRFRRATCDWALDSGGFSELTLYGKWTVSAEQYAEEVQTYAAEVGRLDWAACQDWMCEPAVLEGGGIAGRTAPGTGKSIEEHQDLTVKSVLDLRSMAPDMKFAPVLQGWEIDDYLRHVEDYAAAGIDLSKEEVVGVGSVCRRQGSEQIRRLMQELHSLDISLHGFGVKTQGLPDTQQYLSSADSLAWSFAARRTPVLLEECIGSGHKNCANCMRYAMVWRDRLLEKLV